MRRARLAPERGLGPAPAPGPRWARLLVATLGAIAGVGSCGVGTAFAFWSSSNSSQPGLAGADSLPAGATPTAPTTVPDPSSSTVSLSFDQVDTVSGHVPVPAADYRIRRYPVAGGAPVVVTASCSGTGTITCTETSVPDGQWQYTDTPVWGTNWVGTESTKSPVVTVGPVSPTVTVTYPVDHQAYSATSWTGTITGTASDPSSSVTSMAVAIEDTTTSAWWNGASFGATAQLFEPATGTTTWSYTLAPGHLDAGDTYAVTGRATDVAGSTGTSPTVTFVFAGTAPTISSISPTTGPTSGGTSVVVAGTDFVGVTSVDFGTAPSTFHVTSATRITANSPPGTGTVDVTVTTTAGRSPTAPADRFTYVAPQPPPPAATGYDLVGADGGVFVFDAPDQTGGFYGSLPGIHVVPNKPIVGMVPTVTDQGYFLVGADGGVFAFGNAPFLGSLPGIGVAPAQPITGIVAANTDRGYFLVGRDGGVFAFGTVPFLGSLPGRGTSVDDIIGIASTPSGNGYWLVAQNGKVYAFGRAQQLGTALGTPSPVSAIAGTPTGGGYWITTQDGAVYAYGNAKSFGTLPALRVTPNLPVIGVVRTARTAGYWLLGADGGIFAFGDAPFYGSLPGLGIHVTDIVGAVPN